MARFVRGALSGAEVRQVLEEMCAAVAASERQMLGQLLAKLRSANAGPGELIAPVWVPDSIASACVAAETDSPHRDNGFAGLENLISQNPNSARLQVRCGTLAFSCARGRW